MMLPRQFSCKLAALTCAAVHVSVGGSTCGLAPIRKPEVMAVAAACRSRLLCAQRGGALALTEVAAQSRALTPHGAAKLPHPPLPPASLSSKGLASLPPKPASKSRGDPIPFFGSKAESFRLNDAIYVNPTKGRYAIPLGLSLFCFIMYFGFFRPYDEGDQAVVDSLTSDKNLPEAVRASFREAGVVLPEASSQQCSELDRSES